MILMRYGRPISVASRLWEVPTGFAACVKNKREKKRRKEGLSIALAMYSQL
jgi:hypothetical protein